MRALHLAVVAALAHLAAIARYALADEHHSAAGWSSRSPTDKQPDDQQSGADSQASAVAYKDMSSNSSSANQTSSEVYELSPFEAARLGYFTHSPAVSVTLTIAYSVVFIVGIVGNSFVVAIVCKSPRMRTVTNFFIANLALADILVLVFCLPATLISNLFVPYVLGLFFCKTVSYLQGVAVSASINTMVAVTLDRFLAICFPMDWHMSRRAARWTIACIWLFSLSIALPWALYFTLIPFPNGNRTIQVCAEDWPSERLETVYFVCANLILCYLFPATLIIICYLGIWYKIERRDIPGDRPKGLKIELIMQKSKLKVIKMMMVVVVMFLLSWLPLYLIMARIKLTSERSPTEEWLISKTIPLAQWLGASNSCINPILYTFFNRKYKRGFIDLLRLGLCCKPNEVLQAISNQTTIGGHHHGAGELQSTNGTSLTKCAPVSACRRPLQATNQLHHNQVLQHRRRSHQPPVSADEQLASAQTSLELEEFSRARPADEQGGVAAASFANEHESLAADEELACAPLSSSAGAQSACAGAELPCKRRHKRRHHNRGHSHGHSHSHSNSHGHERHRHHHRHRGRRSDDDKSADRRCSAGEQSSQSAQSPSVDVSCPRRRHRPRACCPPSSHSSGRSAERESQTVGACQRRACRRSQVEEERKVANEVNGSNNDNNSDRNLNGLTRAGSEHSLEPKQSSPARARQEDTDCEPNGNSNERPNKQIRPHKRAADHANHADQQSAAVGATSATLVGATSPCNNILPVSPDTERRNRHKSKDKDKDADDNNNNDRISTCMTGEQLDRRRTSDSGGSLCNDDHY